MLAHSHKLALLAGSFVAGLKSGRGSYQYPNGDWYKGEWFQGKKHGQGTYFVKQGDCHFIGEWSEGSFVAGDWKLKDGSFYRGHFVDGRPAAGSAVYTFRNGNVQYGEWIAKKRELAEGEEEEVPEGEGSCAHENSARVLQCSSFHLLASAAPKPKFTMIWRSTTVTSFAQRPKERPCRMLTLFFVLAASLQSSRCFVLCPARARIQLIISTWVLIACRTRVAPRNVLVEAQNNAASVAV